MKSFDKWCEDLENSVEDTSYPQKDRQEKLTIADLCEDTRANIEKEKEKANQEKPKKTLRDQNMEAYRTWKGW
jgi:hypothetical protein